MRPELCESAPAASSHATGRTRAWREPEHLVIVLLVAAIYLPRLTSLTIRGEESRWARVALEMMDTGDWIVPRQQGQPFADRPPLGSWAIAAASGLTGELNLLAIRLPAVLATIATALTIYLYARNFLSRLGALAAALAYPTMVQVLLLGRMGEVDALLTLCVAGSLFCWHYGYAVRSKPAIAWCAGYALAALAGLTKGPQGPLYFAAATFAYLAVERDWKFLFSRWHLAGIAVFLAIVAAWQLPFCLELDAATAQAAWSEGGEFAKRFQYASVGKTLLRWAAYPFELYACMMPWSFMLPVLATPWFRQQAGAMRPALRFLITACAVALPTCWLPADTRPRYFMSLYPAVAILCGASIQRCWEAATAGWWQRSWDRFLNMAIVLILGASIALPLLAVFHGALPRGLGEGISLSFALALALCGLVGAPIVLWRRQLGRVRGAQASLVVVAGFFGLFHWGVVISAQMRNSNNPAAEIAVIREMIPPGEQLVSIRPTHHLFAWYYQEPIALCPSEDRATVEECTGTYFCFAVDPAMPPLEIPIEWAVVREISCDRTVTAHPKAKVIVGRRLDSPTTRSQRLAKAGETSTSGD
jgi:4-amino-4-deoxy-L-arabinose transferase-like glycosyltransferase